MERGPFIPLGAAIAVVVCALDQVLKLWIVNWLELGSRLRILPGLELVLTLNTGISYGLFQQDSMVVRWLLVGIKALAVLLLGVWLARTHVRLTAVALGLIIGGALGNALDRLVHGAVVVFILLYVATATWRYDWYVFNLADAAIVAGVIGLMYESLWRDRAAKAP